MIKPIKPKRFVPVGGQYLRERLYGFKGGGKASKHRIFLNFLPTAGATMIFSKTILS